jgi:hypothetical protein
MISIRVEEGPRASRSKNKSAGSLTPGAESRASVAADAGAVQNAPDQRHAMIAQAAYYLAERRGFEPSHELEDWVAAECEIDRTPSPGSDEAPDQCGD